jgi:hypothetical protein
MIVVYTTRLGRMPVGCQSDYIQEEAGRLHELEQPRGLFLKHRNQPNSYWRKSSRYQRKHWHEICMWAPLPHCTRDISPAYHHSFAAVSSPAQPRHHLHQRSLLLSPSVGTFHDETSRLPSALYSLVYCLLWVAPSQNRYEVALETPYCSRQGYHVSGLQRRSG